MDAWLRLYYCGFQILCHNIKDNLQAIYAEMQTGHMHGYVHKCSRLRSISNLLTGLLHDCTSGITYTRFPEG
jgi:hypothetical protein